MARSKTAAGVGILFLVFFCLAGAGGTTTVKEITATVDMTLPQLFFSLSSASILLLPLSVDSYGAGNCSISWEAAKMSVLRFQ